MLAASMYMPTADSVTALISPDYFGPAVSAVTAGPAVQETAKTCQTARRGS